MRHPPINILFEDNHLLVVEKPVNVPVQADSSGDPDLQLILQDYIRQKYNKPGNVYLGIVHRLDRPVGGVMVFAKTSKAASRLSEQFRINAVQKTYFAVATGIPPAQNGTLRHWLVKDAAKNMVKAYKQGAVGSKEAILHYEVYGKSGDLALLKILLETGRSHQIRVQCSAAGFALWGDQRYNRALSKPGQQIALFAKTLSFNHPVRNEELAFDLPLPDKSPWNQFQNVKD